MRIPGRTGGIAIAFCAALLLLAAAGPAGICAAGAPAKPGTQIDRHIPALQDSTDLGPAIYSFNERYKYDLMPADSALYGTPDQFRILYPNEYWNDRLGKITNEDGSLAWLTSQDMLALARMFDLTGERWYLDWLGKYAEGTMQARDDIAGKKDQEGRLDPGWGSTRYGNQERRIYLVHSGLIVEATLEYVIRARKVEGIDSKSLDKLVERCRETLIYHDYQLDPGSPPGETAYLSGREEPDRKDTWQPYNRQNLLGRDFYLLYKLTGDESYRTRSEKLYTFFKHHIELTPSDAYVWEYEPIRFAKGPIQVASCDDISHATYTIEPVIAAARENFVFQQTDIQRLANTFTKYIYVGDGVFQTSMGCRVNFTPREMDRLYAWLPVSEADPRVYWLLHRFYLHNVAKPVPLAIAYFAIFRPKGMAGIDTRVK